MFVTRFSLAALFVLYSTTMAQTNEVSVVASVKPLHAIAAAVMGGTGRPRLLVRGGASPHDYALRPSDAAALDDADLIIWVGDSFELFLAKPLEALAGEARVIELMSLSGSDKDPHIWLDPANAREIAMRLVAALSDLDPGNAAVYEANADEFSARLERLDEELRAQLAAIADVPYLVFHDAYGYFERRYGLARVGAVTINPQRKPGAQRIAALRQTIRVSGARCLFGEPQFQPALLATLIEGSDARIGILDPLGATLAPGPDAYFTLMRNLARDLRVCLAVAD